MPTPTRLELKANYISPLTQHSTVVCVTSAKVWCLVCFQEHILMLYIYVVYQYIRSVSTCYPLALIMHSLTRYKPVTPKDTDLF